MFIQFEYFNYIVLVDENKIQLVTLMLSIEMEKNTKQVDFPLLQFYCVYLYNSHQNLMSFFLFYLSQSAIIVF